MKQFIETKQLMELSKIEKRMLEVKSNIFIKSSNQLTIGKLIEIISNNSSIAIGRDVEQNEFWNITVWGVKYHGTIQEIELIDALWQAVVWILKEGE